jgi:hypothetical protein
VAAAAGDLPRRTFSPNFKQEKQLSDLLLPGK